MKNVICWVVAIVLLYIGITAFKIHETGVGIALVAVAVAAVWASGGKEKSGASRRR